MQVSSGASGTGTGDQGSSITFNTFHPAARGQGAEQGEGGAGGVAGGVVLGVQAGMDLAREVG